MKPRRVPKLRATPLARKCAAAAGVDLATVKGTGPRGRIVSGDVRSVHGTDTNGIVTG